MRVAVTVEVNAESVEAGKQAVQQKLNSRGWDSVFEGEDGDLEDCVFTVRHAREVPPKSSCDFTCPICGAPNAVVFEKRTGIQRTVVLGPGDEGGTVKFDKASQEMDSDSTTYVCAECFSELAYSEEEMRRVFETGKLQQ